MYKGGNKIKRDLGADHQGRDEYIALRYTQVLLVPLSIWFLYFVITNIGLGATETVKRLSGLFNTSLMTLFILTSLYHFNIVLTVIIDDYVHGHIANILSKMFVKLSIVFMTIISLIAICRFTMLMT